MFRKGDASSCLVVETPWEDILDKPFLFDEMKERVLLMVHAAQEQGLLTKVDTLKVVKNAINSVLIRPFQAHIEVSQNIPVEHEGNVKADAFWDEIPDVPKDLKEALDRLFQMRAKIDDNIGNQLDDKSTLMDTKTTVNENVLMPLNDINEDE